MADPKQASENGPIATSRRPHAIVTTDISRGLAVLRSIGESPKQWVIVTPRTERTALRGSSITDVLFDATPSATALEHLHIAGWRGKTHPARDQ